VDDTHVLHEGLELAVEVCRAGGAVLGVRGEDEFEGERPDRLDLGGAGAHDQTVGDGGLACLDGSVHPVDLDDAQPTATRGGQIGMRAQMGDVDAGVEAGAQDVHAGGGLDLPAVHGDVHHRLAALRHSGGHRRRSGMPRRCCAGHSHGAIARPLTEGDGPARLVIAGSRIGTRRPVRR